MDVAVHHRHHITLDPVAITLTLAAHQHLGAYGIGVTRREGVLAMGLLKASTHAVDSYLPQLGVDGLEHLLIINALHLGFQISPDLKASFHPLIILMPDAAALVSRETWLPCVTVLVSAAEHLAQVAAGFNGGGCGHGIGADAATLPINPCPQP